jgi:Kdo2-lipid IVA lauroyltransferase/acyltransferase
LGSSIVGKLAVGILRLLSWMIYLLPWVLRRGMGAGIGRLLLMMKLREEVVRDNLQIAYPGKSIEMERQRAELFKSSYRELGHLMTELLLLVGPLRRHVLKRIEFRGKENIEAVQATGRKIIFLGSHLGNWEIMAAAGGLHGKVNSLIVTKHLKPEWLHQAIEAGRASCDVLGAYEPQTMKKVLAHLRNNKPVAFVLDQYAGPPIGVRVPFFDQPVGTANTVATLARRTGAAVIPVVNYRMPNGKHVVEVAPALDWIGDENPAKELALNTAHYVKVLESDIRRFPAQWLWIHRRFKGDLSPLRQEEWSERRVRR